MKEGPWRANAYTSQPILGKVFGIPCLDAIGMTCYCHLDEHSIGCMRQGKRLNQHSLNVLQKRVNTFPVKAKTTPCQHVPILGNDPPVKAKTVAVLERPAVAREQIARVVVDHRDRVPPAGTGDVDVGHIGLPQLVRRTRQQLEQSPRLVELGAAHPPLLQTTIKGAGEFFGPAAPLRAQPEREDVLSRTLAS